MNTIILTAATVAAFFVGFTLGFNAGAIHGARRMARSINDTMLRIFKDHENRNDPTGGC